MRFWGQEFCFILVSLKPATGSCSALLFPHIIGGQTLPAPPSVAKCRAWSLERPSL